MDSLKMKDLNELATRNLDNSSVFCEMWETFGNELPGFKYLVILDIASISRKDSFAGAITIRAWPGDKKPNELVTRNLNISSFFCKMGETLRNELPGFKYLVILGIASISRKDSFPGALTIMASPETEATEKW